MTYPVTATFEFEHETVLGDLLDIMTCYNAKVQDIGYQGYDSEIWELTLAFPNNDALNGFVEDLGRNQIRD